MLYTYTNARLASLPLAGRASPSLHFLEARRPSSNTCKTSPFYEMTVSTRALLLSEWRFRDDSTLRDRSDALLVPLQASLSCFAAVQALELSSSSNLLPRDELRLILYKRGGSSGGFGSVHQPGQKPASSGSFGSLLRHATAAHAEAVQNPAPPAASPPRSPPASSPRRQASWTPEPAQRMPAPSWSFFKYVPPGPERNPHEEDEVTSRYTPLPYGADRSPSRSPSPTNARSPSPPNSPPRGYSQSAGAGSVNRGWQRGRPRRRR